MPWTVWIPVVLCLVTMAVGFLKYITNLDTRLVSLITKFDERTTNIGLHLSKIDNVLRDLVSSAGHIDTLKDQIADHEGRLRNLKSPAMIDGMARDVDDHEHRIRMMESNMRIIRDNLVVNGSNISH